MTRAARRCPTIPPAARQKTESWQVRLDPGRHRLAVVAESDVSNGQSDEIEVIYEEQRAAEPRLYALLVGVADYEDESLRLKYAADDAELLERVLRDKAARAFAGVEVQRFVDRKATKQAFLDGLKWLKDSMKPQDVGIIFFSGHGHRDDDGIFYMLPAEVKRRNIDATGLDGALFKRKLAGIKGTLVVMLDACHAGAVEKEAGGERQLRPITDDFVRDMVREDYGNRHDVLLHRSGGLDRGPPARPWLLHPGPHRRPLRPGRLQQGRLRVPHRAGQLPVRAGQAALDTITSTP